MKHTFTQVREVVTSVLQLEVDDFCITKSSINDGTAAETIKSSCSIDGHDLEIRFHPALYVHGDGYYCSALELVFLGESRTGVTAVLGAKVSFRSCYETHDFVPLKENMTAPRSFHRRFDRSLPIYIGVGKANAGDSYLGSLLTVECTITMFREPAQPEGAIPVPSSNLTQHPGELLRSQAAADVTFSVKGESFGVHKSMLAARCPVLMAEFFGELKEENSLLVEIQDMDIAVFKAMLHFIYTDEVPELDEKPEAATMALAESLLNAADRYGLNRLKVMCERRLSLGMDVSTVASMLVVAEERNCSRLKAQCIEFIAGGSPENLDAVLATEGYRHLVERPMVLTELLKAAHGKIGTSSCKPRHRILFQDQCISTQAATPGTIMNHTFTQLSEGVQSVHLLKIDGCSVTKATIGYNTNCIKSRCNVDGYDLEIRFYTVYHHHLDIYGAALELAFLGEACTEGVEASLSGHLVEYQSFGVAPRECKPVSKIFKQPLDCTHRIVIGRWKGRDSQPPASLTVECTITVLRDLKTIRPPTSDLHQHLEELLHRQAGVDVIFTVSGESFAAHKNILAARSPVFRAEFFGDMQEKASQCVEIMDMDPQAFKAMLHFIYTDMVPADFDNQEDGTVMAQHLLVAGDRYGLDRLKSMSEHRLSHSIGIETVASTLALAVQFNCSHLKAKCIEFISGGSSKNVDAVLATEGYRQLEVSCPSVLKELLEATHRNKRSRSTYS